jgi:hypothetical protein
MKDWQIVMRHAVAIAKRCKTTPVVLIGARRTGRIPHGRDELAWTLRHVEGWTIARVAEQLGRDRWWACHASRNHAQRIQEEARREAA